MVQKLSAFEISAPRTFSKMGDNELLTDRRSLQAFSLSTMNAEFLKKRKKKREERRKKKERRFKILPIIGHVARPVIVTTASPVAACCMYYNTHIFSRYSDTCQDKSISTGIFIFFFIALALASNTSNSFNCHSNTILSK